MAGNDPMLDVYIYENTQLLEGLEQVLLDGERQKTLTQDQINEVFRTMHTIKGSSAMMEYNNLAHVSHAIEDLFSLIREHDPEADDWEEIFDIVLKGSDYLRSEIDKLANGGSPDAPADEMIASFRSYYKVLKTKFTGDVASVAAATSSSATPAGAAGAQVGGDVYRARIYFEEDCKMENIRAFGVVNEMRSKGAVVVSDPSDLFVEGVDSTIAAVGCTLYILTRERPDELRDIITDTMFLKDFSFDQLDVASEELPEELRIALVPTTAETKTGAAAAGTAAAAAQPGASAAGPVPEFAKQSFISVNVSKLDSLLNLVGEIVTTESMVVKNPELENLNLDTFEKAAQQLRKLTDELQDIVMSIRMVPISSTFQKMNRLVRDMSKKVGKEIDLTLIGEETEVDKTIGETLSDPLMHMIRNSVDHGLESAEERRAAGKSDRGSITLEARNTGGDIMILISDNGRGLNRDKLLAKAAERGLLTKAEHEYSDKEAYSFIFAPGFSTNKEVTEFSGRGVGMDVVRRNVDNVGGSLSVDSNPGQGMTTTIRIPLTLAIVDGMRVRVGGESYILPVLAIRQSFQPKPGEAFADPDGTELIMVRGVCYRILRLGAFFGVESARSTLEEGTLVMIESNLDTPVCLFVDELIGEQQAVVKPLPSYITRSVEKLPGVSGCTVLGDGSISLILDINSLLAAH